MKSYHPYALTTAFFWSVGFVFTRLAVQYYSPPSLGFLRHIVASLTVIIFALIAKISLPKRKDILWFIAAGFTGFSLYAIAFNTGAQYVSSATSSFIVATAPLITSILASLVYREKLNSKQWLAIMVEFVGIGILTLYGKELTINVGILWLLAAALSVSIYNIIQRKLTRTYTALQSSAYSILLGTALLAIYSPRAINEVSHAPIGMIFIVAVLGVFSSAVAFISWSKAMEIADNTASVSNYMFLTPFITTILAFFIAGEKPELPSLFGGTVIIIGAYLFGHYKTKQ